MLDCQETYTIWRINARGGADLVDAGIKADSARMALNECGVRGTMEEGALYFVADPTLNGNGAQALFRWTAPPVITTTAVGVSLEEAAR